MQSKESHENSPLCCGWELMTSYGQTGKQQKKIWDAVLCRLVLPPHYSIFCLKAVGCLFTHFQSKNAKDNTV